ncbi:MAG: cytidylate kinase-like family protein [Thermodesulfobacteriota bacterium]
MEDAQKEYKFRSYILEQLEKWEKQKNEEKDEEVKTLSVVTVSSQPGSGGQVVARKISEHMGYDLFDREIINRIAKSADISSTVIETLEKERLTGMEDLISSIINKKYIWPGVYLDHLVRVVSVIGKHGRAVIVGRGANFILPPKERIAIRVTAPLDFRVSRISKNFDVTYPVARKRVLNRESKRRSFVRKAYNADISDPMHYELVFNMENLSVEDAAESVVAIISRKKES